MGYVKTNDARLSLMCKQLETLQYVIKNSSTGKLILTRLFSPCISIFFGSFMNIIGGQVGFLFFSFLNFPNLISN